jgi:hypothetical protein
MTRKHKEFLIWAVVIILMVVAIVLTDGKQTANPCHYDTHSNCN